MITIYSVINYLSRIQLYHTVLNVIALSLIVLILFIPSYEENTIKLGKHYIFYKYILFVLFLISYFISYDTVYFVPLFSALLVVIIMYLMRVISTFKNNKSTTN